MTFEIALVLVILAVSLVMFVIEKLPMDLIALIVLGILALTGLVNTEQALAGFSNPAVVTVWAMFILSDGLTRTGIADILGKQILRFAGTSEPRIIIVIMMTSGGLSAIMNNIGVAALMLPVVIDIAGKTGRPPSRLLMPLAYGTLLGGLMTLIGTPPNLLVSDALSAAGQRSFALFDYTPIGLAIMIVGTLFVAFFGRKLLPESHLGADIGQSKSGNLLSQYGLSERTMVLRVPEGSALQDRSLTEIRFASALNLSVLAIMRDNQVFAGPRAQDTLKEKDLLLVQGKLDRFRDTKKWPKLFGETRDADLTRLYSQDIRMIEVEIAGDAPMIGRNLLDIDLKGNDKLSIIALRRGDHIFRSRFSGIVVEAGDRFLLMGQGEDLDKARDNRNFLEYRTVPIEELDSSYELKERIFEVDVPMTSPLAGQTLLASRLGEAFSFSVIGILRDGKTELLPGPSDVIQARDRLIIQGWREYRNIINALDDLEIEEQSNLSVDSLVGSEYGFAEAVVPPRSSIARKSPRELNFYDRYKLQLLAVWRQGKVQRSNLRNLPLHFGDAFLLFGQRKQLELLAKDPNFLLLTPSGEKPKQTRKAPIAASIMALVLLPVLIGWLPIAIAAVAGATLMVLFGCLSMADAYRSIEWRSIFLIAGMLPLGLAMEQTGAAALIAEGVMSLVGDMGPWPVIIGLYLVTAIATTIIPTAALVVMMAPIMLKASADMGIPPQTGMMAIAMAASASFTSPISHPANILVMGPGGYRFIDYIKLGVPLAIVVAITTFLLLPILWPLG